MEYIPDYLKPFIIHKDYFPELTLIPQHYYKIFFLST